MGVREEVKMGERCGQQYGQRHDQPWPIAAHACCTLSVDAASSRLCHVKQARAPRHLAGLDRGV